MKTENWGDVINILKAIDTDCNGVINYTGNFKYLLNRICCSNNGKKYVYEKREIIISI